MATAKHWWYLVGEVLPSRAGLYSLHGAGGKTVLACDYWVWPCVFFDRLCLRRGQSGVTARLSSDVTTFGHCIMDVVHAGPQKQMVEFKASGVIAPMTNEKSFRYWTVGHRPNESMDKMCPPPISDLSVPMLFQAPGPNSTPGRRQEVTTAVNVLDNLLYGAWWSHFLILRDQPLPGSTITNDGSQINGSDNING